MHFTHCNALLPVQKQWFPIFVTDRGIVKDLSPHGDFLYENTPSPKVVTVSGIISSSRHGHSRKA